MTILVVDSFYTNDHTSRVSAQLLRWSHILRRFFAESYAIRRIFSRAAPRRCVASRRVVATDLCWFYACDLVRSFRTNLNESKRRGEEKNIQRDDNSAGESVARVNTTRVRSWNSPSLRCAVTHIFSVDCTPGRRPSPARICQQVPSVLLQSRLLVENPQSRQDRWRSCKDRIRAGIDEKSIESRYIAHRWIV